MYLQLALQSLIPLMGDHERVVSELEQSYELLQTSQAKERLQKAEALLVTYLKVLRLHSESNKRLLRVAERLVIKLPKLSLLFCLVSGKVERAVFERALEQVKRKCLTRVLLMRGIPPNMPFMK